VRNAPLMLKLQYRDADAFRQVHDRYVITLAARQGVRWTAQVWSEVLHGTPDFKDDLEPIVASAIDVTGPVLEPATEEL
jgi:hypothetical protein